MERTMVLLKDGTVGELIALLPHDKVEVKLQDNDGNLVNKIGEVEAYL